MRSFCLTIALSIFCITGALAAESNCDFLNMNPVSESTSKKTIAVGAEYQPMTWWKSFEISNAYYTNPDALKKIDVAYLYSPTQFSDAQHLDQIYEAASEGKLLLAISNDKKLGIKGNVVLTSLDDPTFKTTTGINDPKSFKSYLDNNMVYVASSGKEICGWPAKAVLLKASDQMQVK